MQIPIYEYLLYLSIAAFISYGLINNQSSNKIKEAERYQKLTPEEIKERKEWDSEYWFMFGMGTFFGAPIVDGILSVIRHLAK